MSLHVLHTLSHCVFWSGERLCSVLIPSSYRLKCSALKSRKESFELFQLGPPPRLTSPVSFIFVNTVSPSFLINCLGAVGHESATGNKTLHRIGKKRNPTAACGSSPSHTLFTDPFSFCPGHHAYAASSVHVKL